jgi:hypothetical protein
MALALNVFRTITNIPTASPVGIYTAPIGYTGVVLLAQATNISNTSSYDVSFSHQRSVSGIAVTTEIAKKFPISANDTAYLLPGKLVLETGDTLVLSTSNGSTNIKFIASILETLN